MSGVARLRERRRHGDRHGVAAPELRLVVGRQEAAGGHLFGDLGGGDVLDVRLAGVEEVDDPAAHVVAHDGVAGLRELHGERQADVPEPDDADDGGAVGDAAEELILHNGKRSGRWGGRSRRRWHVRDERRRRKSAGAAQRP
jgi:hypothetical protein